MADETSNADEEATYRAIGRFVFEFSQLEYSIRHAVAVELKLSDEVADAVMTHDIAMLCKLARIVLAQRASSSHRDQLPSIMNKVHQLNETRVRVAHGLWVPFLDGGRVFHTPRQTLKPSMGQDQAKELEAQATKANQLRNEFEDWLWDDGIFGLS